MFGRGRREVRVGEVVDGRWGEEAALRWARRAGMKLLARNVRARCGEVDLVLREGRALVFCEVKARRHGGRGTPLEAITPAKQRRVANAARYYLVREGLSPSDVACRFDACAVEPGPRGSEVTWVRGAFDAPD